MPNIWSGHYLDGRTPVRHDVTVSVTRSGLAITSADGTTRLWPLAECRQTQGCYAGEPVRFERGGDLGEAVIVSDVGFLAAIRDVAAESRRVHDPRRRGRRLRLTVAAALAAIGLVTATYVWGIPVAARFATRAVPIAWEERLGEAMYERFMEDERICADPALQNTIDEIMAVLLAPRRHSPYRLRVVVVDSPVVNAFAFPGGRIVIMRGLLEFTDSAEMLAGTLAHEAQHVLQRHTTRALLQHASTGLLVAAISGDVSGLVAFGLESTRVLGSLRYSRQAEAEADREGARLLIDAGVSPAGDIAYFEKRARDAGAEADSAGIWRYLSTHPSNPERVAAIRDLASHAASAATKLLPGRDWKNVRRMCESP